MGDFWSSRTFFFSNLMGRIFFSLFFSISFLLHLCCMQFFSSDKRLQEIFNRDFMKSTLFHVVGHRKTKTLQPQVKNYFKELRHDSE